MIKRNGQRIAAITMAVALMGQNVTPIFSLENLTESEFQHYLEIYNTVIGDNIKIQNKLEKMKELNDTYEESTIDFINDIGETSLVCAFDGIEETQLENIHFIFCTKNFFTFVYNNKVFVKRIS